MTQKISGLLKNFRIAMLPCYRGFSLSALPVDHSFRWRQEGVRWPQEGVRWYQEGVRWHQEGVGWHQEGVRWRKEGVT